MPAFTFDPSRADDGDDPTDGPRTLFAHPEWFGQFSDPLDPADGVDPADARFVAANTQHWIANRVREGVLMDRTNLASYLADLRLTFPGMTHEHASKTLHGYEPMALADLVVWGNEFDTVREILQTVFADGLR